MKFRIRFAQQVVGVFVLVAILFVAIVVVSMGANQRWFARNYTYYSVFPTAEGLSVGMSLPRRGSVWACQSATRDSPSVRLPG